jgi:outer membrane receptor protein involved in Fe transport
MNYLFANSDFKVHGAGTSNLAGNADLDAERTVMYEAGLQQQLTNNLFIHLTGFYRDIRDWIGVSEPISMYNAQTYHKYVNKDHATAKGITLNTFYSQSNLNIALDYTFMTAKGTTSDPQEAYLVAIGDEEPRRQLIPLDWDQTHSLKLNFTYFLKGWNIGLISTLQSGFPYTPQIITGEAVGANAAIGFRENSKNQPTTYDVRMRLSKRFELYGLDYEFSLNVYNLFDTRNARSVYGDTGEPGFTRVDANFADNLRRFTSFSEYTRNPGNYYPPRFLQLSLGVTL